MRYYFKADVKLCSNVSLFNSIRKWEWLQLGLLLCTPCTISPGKCITLFCKCTKNPEHMLFWENRGQNLINTAVLTPAELIRANLMKEHIFTGTMPAPCSAHGRLTSLSGFYCNKQHSFVHLSKLVYSKKGGLVPKWHSKWLVTAL